MEVLSEECREKGNECMKEEKYIEAMFHYTRGVKLEPSNAYLYSNRSLAFLKMQQYYHALEDAKTTIRMMPKWPKGYFRKAEIECAAEHYKEAIESYREGLLVQPNEPGLKEGLAKATKLYHEQRKADNRFPFFGLAFGSLIGILLVVFDEAITKKPIFENDVLRVMVLVGIIGICYGFALLYRYFVRSQRTGLLEAPVDLLGVPGGVDNFFTSNPEPSSSPAPSAPTSSENSEKSSKSSQQQPAKGVNQRKKVHH